MTAQGGPTEEPPVLRWVLRYAVPLAGLGGAAVYGVLRLSYALFYLHLRVTPEEAGYGYAEVLAGQLIGAIELVILLALLFLAVALVGRSLTRGIARKAGRRVRPRPGLPWARRAAVRSVIAALVVVVIGLPAIAWEMGASAAAGWTARNIYLRPLPIPVLPVQAVPATLLPLDDGSVAARELSERRCLMYLGQSEGTAVFFDVATADSVRVSADAFVITLRWISSVPTECVAQS